MEMAVAAGATSAQGKRRFRAAPSGLSLVRALVRPACRVAFAGLMSFCFSNLAVAKDDSDNGSATTAASGLPNLYLDLRTTYATVPANTLSIGLGNSALFAMLPRFPALPTFSTLPVLPTVSSPSSQTSASIFR
jgi:hypothetical protein